MMIRNWNIGVVAMLAWHGMGLAAAADDLHGSKAILAVSEQERAQATAQFIGGTKKLSLERLKQSQDTFLDGAKGYTPSESVRPRLIKPEVRQKYFAQAACEGSLTGLVELINAKSFTGVGDNGIFTKFRFRVVDDWRVQPAPSRPYVDIIMHVGEMVHEGQRYRADNPEARYTIGKQYILLAGKLASGTRGSLIGAPAFLEVSDGIIYPAPSVTHFAPGTTVEQAKLEVENAVLQEGCR
ncbi:MAG: hypothetical protein ABW202_21765 [Duganella sp.]